MVKLFECYKYNDEWLLIEMLIEENAYDIDWGKIVVPDENLDKSSWQCPYMEQYLNEDGTEKLCEVYDEPEDDVNPARVAFFIYMEGSKMLRTPYGEFDLTNPQDLPERLESIIEFEDVD